MAKNKMKSHSGAKKRFSVTGTGKIRHYHSGHSHKLQVKGAARRRRLKKVSVIDPTNERKIRALIPYK